VPDNGRPGVLFDVDGTLLDTNYLHTIAWSRALREAGEWAPMNAIHRLVGMGGDQLLPTLLGHDSREADAAHRRHFRALADEVVAFPGASELLERTRELGLVAVLATSSPKDQLVEMLESTGLLDTYDAWTTADDVDTSKPDPGVFLQAMKTAGLDPGRTVALGDSVWDVQAAQAAGIACIAVESGGFSRHELSEAGALTVYRDVAELLASIGTSPLADLDRGSGREAERS
jgi:HAD superfamily hydrolase (TIGR01509 family)